MKGIRAIIYIWGKVFKNGPSIILNTLPHIQFCRTDIVHIKNGKSYQSRYIQDSERLELGEKIAGLLTPEVYWHEQVQNLDDTQFDNGHLKDMPKS